MFDPGFKMTLKKKKTERILQCLGFDVAVKVFISK